MHVDPQNNRHCLADGYLEPDPEWQGEKMDIVDKDANPEDEYIYRTKEVWLGKDAEFSDYFKEIPELQPEEESEEDSNAV